MLRVQLRHADLNGSRARVQMIASRLTDFSVPLEQAAKLVREETRQRFEMRGLGEWPPLAESTVARKVSAGYPDPTRQLYAEGNLFESATSPNGPYSFTHRGLTWVHIGVDWTEGGWQIPLVLSEGAGAGGRFPGRAGASSWRIPARPIYPRKYEMANAISRIIRNWVRAPVEPLSLGGAGGAWTGASTPPLP